MINKWTQVVLWILVAAVSLIEALKQYTENGFSGWKIYALIGLAAFASFMFIVKRKQRNKAPVRKNPK